jgi:hypothetical protein
MFNILHKNTIFILNIKHYLLFLLLQKRLVRAKLLTFKKKNANFNKNLLKSDLTKNQHIH